jgi:hypothetical protein
MREDFPNNGFYPEQDFRIQVHSTRSEIISIFIEGFTERKDPQKYQRMFRASAGRSAPPS